MVLEVCSYIRTSPATHVRMLRCKFEGSKKASSVYLVIHLKKKKNTSMTCALMPLHDDICDICCCIVHCSNWLRVKCEKEYKVIGGTKRAHTRSNTIFK